MKSVAKQTMYAAMLRNVVEDQLDAAEIKRFSQEVARANKLSRKLSRLNKLIYKEAVYEF